jgi:hypothetical protein
MPSRPIRHAWTKSGAPSVWSLRTMPSRRPLSNPARRFLRSTGGSARKTWPSSLEEVEGVHHRLADGAAAVQSIEDCHPIRAADDRLTIEREHVARSCIAVTTIAGYRLLPSQPRGVSGLTASADLQPVTAVLDLVQPVRPGGRLGGAGGDAGRNEIRTGRSDEHPLELSTRFAGRESPECRGGGLVRAAYHAPIEPRK